MSEFPVESEKGTRVDFVLERKASNSYKRLFLVAECKRANPATANWCFVKSPYPHRNIWGSTEYVHLECVKKMLGANTLRGVSVRGVKANADQQAYHSDVKLDEAELATGKIAGANLTRAAWVMCQYSMSPGLKHTAVSSNSPGDLVELYQTEYIRTVPVISASGIQDFMVWVSRLKFDMSY